MKKILALAFLSLFLSSCFSSEEKENIKKVKEDLGVIETNENPNPLSGTIVENAETTTSDNNTKIESSNYSIEYLTENKFIKIDNLDGKDFTSGELKITGKTIMEEVSRIDVSFSNSSSDFKDDSYTLQNFKLGDTSFSYNASSKNQVLDFGKNEYIFTAYSGGAKSQLLLTINVDKKAETVYENKTIGTEDNSIFMEFPKNDIFGEIVMTGENSFTYSKIEDLEVVKTKASDYTCENITDKLGESLSGYYWWNTCRDIIKDKGISFYVLILQNKNYIYEKHYIDFINGLYGILKVEKGELLSGKEDYSSDDKNEALKTKNNELKETNADNEKVKIVDDLFREIVGK